MEEQKYIYDGDTQSAIDLFAEQIEMLPCDILFTQFEGTNEAFFSFSMEVYDEEYQSIIVSMISLMISDKHIEANAISSISELSNGTFDSLALVKQTNQIARMFFDSGFEINHEHDHEHEHTHECDCGDACTCDSGSCEDPNCNHHMH